MNPVVKKVPGAEKLSFTNKISVFFVKYIRRYLKLQIQC